MPWRLPMSRKLLFSESPMMLTRSATGSSACRGAYAGWKRTSARTWTITACMQTGSTVAVLRFVMSVLRWGFVRHAVPVTLSDWFRPRSGVTAVKFGGGRAALPDA